MFEYIFIFLFRIYRLIKIIDYCRILYSIIKNHICKHAEKFIVTGAISAKFLESCRLDQTNKIWNYLLNDHIDTIYCVMDRCLRLPDIIHERILHDCPLKNYCKSFLARCVVIILIAGRNGLAWMCSDRRR